jgi:para-nitrobenzyl esterase
VDRNMQLPRVRITRRVRAKCCAGAIALGTLAAPVPAVASTSAGAAKIDGSAKSIVAISGGALRGKTVGSAQEFLGIPYAAPPVGPLRWRPPHPAAPWKGVRSATKFAPHCPQPVTPFGIASESENCLYLNVYAPSHLKANSKRPVLFWIHGGGLWIGESQDYDPAQLVAEGNVVVTINYRLGALGFLAHPALAKTSGGSSGAYGLMDQQAALRWVHKNIGRFHGNPADVTIAGQSAGGLSVLAQVASTGAHGLFSRAIVQSGAFALNQTPLAKAEIAGEAFATKAGCPTQTAACLRALPISTIEKTDNPGPYGWTPGVIDGAVLKQTIGSALKSGHFNRVPIINGTAHDESRLFVTLGELTGTPVTADHYQELIVSTTGVSTEVATATATEYPLSSYPSPAIALSAVDTDKLFACPALKVDQWASKFVPTYAYEFNDTNAPERFLPSAGFPFGAPHISETQYLFGLPTAPIAGTLSASQQQLATTMRQYWSSFGSEGAPTSSGGPTWPAFSSNTTKLASLVPPRPMVETNFATAHHCAFWAKVG